MLSTSSLNAGEPDIDAALAEWRANHGAGWQVKMDLKTGLALELWGGRLLPQSAPASEDEYRSQVEQCLAAAHDLFGLSPEQQRFRAALGGSYCWGNDLVTDGKYLPGQDSYLQSPAVVLPSPITPTPDQRVILRFYRWLSTDRVAGNATLGLGDYDLAELRLLVGGVEQAFWKNHERIPLVDTASHPGSWVPVEYELTDTLIGNASFQVRWCMDSNGVLSDRPELGGWTIDDVEILRIGALP